MKQIGLILVLAFSLQVCYASDTAEIQTLDSSQRIETVVLDAISEQANDSDKNEIDENAQKNAQWFMYGFLALGAFLVFWKFKYNK